MIVDMPREAKVASGGGVWHEYILLLKKTKRASEETLEESESACQWALSILSVTVKHCLAGQGWPRGAKVEYGMNTIVYSFVKKNKVAVMACSATNTNTIV